MLTAALSRAWLLCTSSRVSWLSWDGESPHVAAPTSPGPGLCLHKPLALTLLPYLLLGGQAREGTLNGPRGGSKMGL